MKHVVFLLEEPSARDLLEGLLPRLLPSTLQVHYLVFEGKQDLERQIVRKIRGWRAPATAFVVLRDQDSCDCRVVKQSLTKLASKSGRSPVLVRVACRELESWILGDWRAIAEAFERPDLAAHNRKETYRTPDRLHKPVEVLRKLLPEYQKRDGARRVGPLLDPHRSHSESFRVFCTGLRRLVETDGP